MAFLLPEMWWPSWLYLTEDKENSLRMAEWRMEGIQEFTNSGVLVKPDDGIFSPSDSSNETRPSTASTKAELCWGWGVWEGATAELGLRLKRLSNWPREWQVCYSHNKESSRCLVICWHGQKYSNFHWPGKWFHKMFLLVVDLDYLLFMANLSNKLLNFHISGGIILHKMGLAWW